MSIRTNKVLRYVLVVRGFVEPEVRGPYATEHARDSAARSLRNADENNGVFWLNVQGEDVKTGAYSNGFMEGLPGFTQ